MKTDFLFELIAKYGIGLAVNGIDDLDEETYDKFCEEYIENSRKRDIQIINHLNANSSFFRTFLPYREGVLDTVFQIQWYYDEIFVYDPIIFHIQRQDTFENKKLEFLHFIKGLNDFRLGIEEGVIIFIGYNAISELIPIDISHSEMYQHLIEDPKIRTELDHLVRVYRVDSQFNETGNYNLEAHYRNLRSLIPMVTVFTKNKDGMHGHMIFDVTARYTPITRDEVVQLGQYERVYSGMLKSYPDEIRETFYYLAVGNKINAPVLFDRHLDELVLGSENYTQPPIHKINTEVLNLKLPFVDNLTSQQALELRVKIPQAFIEFRSHLFLLIEKYLKTEPDPALFKFKVDSEIRSQYRKLDVELRNTLLKFKVLGVGVPVVSVLGLLCLNHFGGDISKMISLSVGASSEATALFGLREQNKIKLDPLYFLWKARNN